MKVNRQNIQNKLTFRQKRLSFDRKKNRTMAKIQSISTEILFLFQIYNLMKFYHTYIWN
jgi:hypothetical protein